jgi:ribosomal protein S27E
MSVREDASETVSTTTTYRTASYTPCEECGEGALVWDHDAGASKCNCCGNVYEGRP